MSRLVTCFWGLLIAASCAWAGILEDATESIVRGNSSALFSLLEKGLDVNSTDPEGNTLLIMAVRSSNQVMVEGLIARRAKVNVRNRHGDSALLLASLSGNLSLVRMLVEAKADVNMKGWTPLIYAAFQGHTTVVDYLAQQGANLEAMSDNGSTALMVAARNGHVDTVRRLIERGADVDPVNEAGESARTWALKGGHTDIVKLIDEALERERQRERSVTTIEIKAHD